MTLQVVNTQQQDLGRVTSIYTKREVCMTLNTAGTLMSRYLNDMSLQGEIHLSDGLSDPFDILV